MVRDISVSYKSTYSYSFLASPAASERLWIVIGRCWGLCPHRMCQLSYPRRVWLPHYANDVNFISFIINHQRLIEGSLRYSKPMVFDCNWYLAKEHDMLVMLIKMEWNWLYPTWGSGFYLAPFHFFALLNISWVMVVEAGTQHADTEDGTDKKATCWGFRKFFM